MKNVILSYPRSGNTWVRYIIEHFSGRPTAYPESSGDNPIASRISMPEVDLKAELFACKSHDVSSLDGTKALVIIRDYKEAIPRHYLEIEKNRPTIDEQFVRETKGLKSEGVDYIKILAQYDQYSGPKLLVHYEDLLLNPFEEVKKITEFFNIYDDDKYQKFCKTYDDHKKRGLSSYHATSRTHGDTKKLKWHQERLNSQVRKNMTQRLKDNYPVLFDRYLKRYE